MSLREMAACIVVGSGNTARAESLDCDASYLGCLFPGVLPASSLAAAVTGPNVPPRSQHILWHGSADNSMFT